MAIASHTSYYLYKHITIFIHVEYIKETYILYIIPHYIGYIYKLKNVPAKEDRHISIIDYEIYCFLNYSARRVKRLKSTIVSSLSAAFK